jgi:hypothetical protein
LVKTASSAARSLMAVATISGRSPWGLKVRILPRQPTYNI